MVSYENVSPAASTADPVYEFPISRAVPADNSPVISAATDLPPTSSSPISSSSPSSSSVNDPGSVTNSDVSDTSADRPTLSYVTLISKAILDHPDKRLVLGDIYQYVMDNYSHYKNSSDRAWRNSIRHNLSINECFIKVGRLENGKGNYWAIHPACVEDFSKGDFRRRQARRRARRSEQLNVSRMSQNYKSNLQYVPMASAPTSGLATSVKSHASGARDYSASQARGSHPYARHPCHYKTFQQPQTKHTGPYDIADLSERTRPNFHQNFQLQRSSNFNSTMPHLQYQCPPASDHSISSIFPKTTADSMYFSQSSLGAIPRERPPVSDSSTTRNHCPTKGSVAPTSRKERSRGTVGYRGDEWMRRQSAITPTLSESVFQELHSMQNSLRYDTATTTYPGQNIFRPIDCASPSGTLTPLSNVAASSGAELMASLGVSMSVPILPSFTPGRSFSEMPALRDAINGLSCLSY